MAQTYTPRLGLPEMADGEQSGYVTFNELSRILDAVLNTDLEAVTATPPGSPQDGQCWFVASGATGVWAGQDFKVAQWYNGIWHFYTPPANITYYDKNAGQRIWIDPVDLVIVPLGTNFAVLTGNPDNGTLSTGGLALTGWDESADLGILTGSMNASTGTFTAPVSYLGSSLFNVLIHVYGDQGNTTKEEDIMLEMIVAGGGIHAGTYELANLTVSTDKTAARTLQSNFAFRLDDGETVSWQLRASANLGTFSFNACTFQVEKVL